MHTTQEMKFPTTRRAPEESVRGSAAGDNTVNTLQSSKRNLLDSAQDEVFVEPTEEHKIDTIDKTAMSIVPAEDESNCCNSPRGPGKSGFVSIKQAWKKSNASDNTGANTTVSNNHPGRMHKSEGKRNVQTMFGHN